MNELRFLEAIGKIDDSLIREADIGIALKPAVPKRRIYAFASVAAAAVIVVGTAAFIYSQKSSEILADNSSAQRSSSVQSTAPGTAASETPSDTVSSALYRAFNATVDPGSDAFSEEEAQHIDVRTADGFYRQLGLDEYEANGISKTVEPSDFGGYIGQIVEVNDSDHHGNAVESQEPTLANADVYFYAPKGDNKAFIIVRKNGQCSIFFSDGIDLSKGFKNGLVFYDVHSADDIQSIDYHIDVPDNGIMVTTIQNTVTDGKAVKSVYDLMCQLEPEDYSLLPEHTGTPQWLVNAWENYRADPNAPEAENYIITFKLRDGTVLREISYQPFLGNGYVEQMRELTPEQNSTLRSLLK